MIKLQNLVKPQIKEEFALQPTLKQEVDNFIKEMIAKRILYSYHRERTGGDMNPNDFVEDLSHKILGAIQQWMETVNNRDNQENQPNMIK